MNYTLHQLQVFLKVAKTGSITRAATELSLTQPAVSIQLRNFQSQFDLPLTELIGRRVQITDFGWEIAGAAEKIIREVEQINDKALRYKGMMTGRLRFSIVSTAQYVLPYFLSGFARRHPGIELNISMANSSQVMEGLMQNESDFSMVSILRESRRVESLVLMDNVLAMVASPEVVGDLKPGEEPAPGSLPLIFREAGSGIRTSMEQFIRERDIRVNRRIELTGNEAVKQALLAGLGCSVMPLVSVRRELDQGILRVVPIRGLPIRTPWRLVWHHRRRFSPAAEAFLEYVKSSREEIVSQWFSGVQ